MTGPPAPSDHSVTGIAAAASDAAAFRPQRLTVSTVALVAANAIALFGVLFLGWQVFPILLIYWLENVTAGAFNVLRMLVCQPSSAATWFMKLFSIPFFCFHYGMFTAVHGSFVFSLFGHDNSGRGLWPSLLSVNAAVRDTGIGFAVLALVISHGVSFVWNYIGGGEFRRVILPQLMAQPYQRVMVLHVVILLGGAAVSALGSPAVAIAILVVLKTAIDLKAHTRERERLSTVATAMTSPFHTR